MTVRVAVAVIGGGPAGSSAALTLARSGVSAVIVDRRKTIPLRHGEALPPAAAQVLKDLGRTDLQPDRHLRSFGVRACWGSDSMTSTDFIFSGYGHGWHLNREQFDEDGLSSAAAAGVPVVRTVHPITIAWDPRGATVSARGEGGPSTIRADFVLDCTGRAAVVAASQGIRRIKHDALVAASLLLEPLRHTDEGDNDATTTIEATRDGWWYTCRIPSGCRVLTYLTDADLLPARADREVGHLMGKLEDAPRIQRLCDADHWRPRGGVGFCRAESSRLTRFFGERWLAAGDAALAFDPLSSIGVLSAAVGGASRR